MEALLSAGGAEAAACLPATNRRGFTPYQCAEAKGHAEAAQWLLQAEEQLARGSGGSSSGGVAAEGRDGATSASGASGEDVAALHQAAGEGDVAKLGQLLQRVSPNEVLAEGDSALHAAAKAGRAAAVQVLIAAGADPNLQNRSTGLTPLHWWVGGWVGGCAWQAGQVVGYAAPNGHSWMRWLCCACCIPVLLVPLACCPPGAGSTSAPSPASCRASCNGHAAAIDVLLAGGAHPNRRNSTGATPLLWAASEGRVDAIRALLDGGADVNVPTEAGLTPLHW